jgi:hypothetical protein
MIDSKSLRKRKPATNGRSALYPLIPIGTKFGRLTVTENNLETMYGGMWKRVCRLRCECGKKVVSPYNHLRSGRRVSCGCAMGGDAKAIAAKRHPLIPVGTKFGRWTVLENDLYKSFGNQTHRACRVRCECRAEAVRTYGELRCGRSPSCGCKSKERNIETVWRQMHNALKRRGWDFHLTLPELKFVTQLPCAYCGKEPSNVFRVKYKVDGVYQRGVDPSMEIRWSGLDRVDSSKGYVYGNVVPCCGECNGMKSKLPLDVFLSLVERIRSHNPTVAGIQRQAATLFESHP